MTKPQHKKPARRSALLKTVLISTGLLLLIAPVAYVSYQKYLTHQEAQSFAALKQDMLTLQTEFNKIEPGWEYSEGCRGGQGEFGRNSAQSCSIVLELKDADGDRFDQYTNIIELNGNFVMFNAKRYQFEDSTYRQVNYEYKIIICRLLETTVLESKKNYTVSCSGNSRNFYFSQLG